jgi:hypothetical protein
MLLCLGLVLGLFTPLLHAAHGGEAEVKIDEIKVGEGIEALRFARAR